MPVQAAFALNEDGRVADRAKIILSAYGGRLPVEAKVNQVKQAVEAVELDYELELTNYAGHALVQLKPAGRSLWLLAAMARLMKSSMD